MWNLTVIDSAKKELKKLPKNTALNLIERIEERIQNQEDPTRFSKPLKHQLSGFWRLRVENYRIVFRVIEDERTIQITRVAHRKKVYE